jgi:hypothetical protein
MTTLSRRLRCCFADSYGSEKMWVEEGQPQRRHVLGEEWASGKTIVHNCPLDGILVDPDLGYARGKVPRRIYVPRRHSFIQGTVY